MDALILAMAARNAKKIEEIAKNGGSGLPEGATAYQQLVTDAEGNAVWEERTHYVELEPVIIETQTVSMEDEGDGYYSGLLSVSLDNIPTGECVVIWDGIEYASTAVTEGAEAVIGNLSMLNPDLPDSGEPFVAFVTDITNEELVSFVFCKTSESTHTFSLTGYAENVTTIPTKYIPELDFVSIHKQELSDSQKIQVRMNIGAGSSDVATNSWVWVDEGTHSYANMSQTSGYKLGKFIDNNIIGPCVDGDAFVCNVRNTGTDKDNKKSRLFDFREAFVRFSGKEPSYGYNRVVSTGIGNYVRLATDDDTTWTTVLITSISENTYTCLLPLYNVPVLK